MDLEGRVFVVVGGAGVAGEAVAAGLLRHGAVVAITSRTESRLAAVRREFNSARLLGYKVGESLADHEAVRDRIITDLGPLDGVIASLGAWWEGPPLTQLDPAVWNRILADNLTSHFIAGRTYLPALAGRLNSVYITLGGVAATVPLPHAGPISVTGAAQTRLLEVLAAECTGVRLHEVRVMTPIVTRRWDRTDRDPDWLSGEQVGDYLAAVVSPGFPRAGQLVLHLPEP